MQVLVYWMGEMCLNIILVNQFIEFIQLINIRIIITAYEKCVGNFHYTH